MPGSGKKQKNAQREQDVLKDDEGSFPCKNRRILQIE
jgi:hypothetical protein